MILSKKKIILNINNLMGIFMYMYIVSYVLFFQDDVNRYIYNIILMLFIGIGLLYILSKKRIYISIYSITLLIYGLILLVSYIYTPSKGAGLYALQYFLISFVIIFILTNYIDTYDKIISLIKAIAWSGAALTFKTLNFYGVEVFNMGKDYTGNANTAFRIGGELGNSNSLGMYFLFAFLSALFLVLQNKVKNRWLYIVISVFCLIFGLLSGSKKTILILLVGLLVLFIYKTRKTSAIKKISNLLFVLIFLLFFYFIIMEIPIFSTIKERIDEFIILFGDTKTDSDDYSRILLIDQGLKMFYDSPIYGIGIYGLSFYFGSYAHNNYVEVLANTGLIGFLIFYSVYLFYLIKVFKGILKSSEFKSIAYAILILIIILGFTLVYYFNVYFHILFMLVTIIVDMETKKKSENRKETL